MLIGRDWFDEYREKAGKRGFDGEEKKVRTSLENFKQSKRVLDTSSKACGMDLR